MNRISPFLTKSRFRDIRRAMTTAGFCETIERIHMQESFFVASDLAVVSCMHTCACNLLEAEGIDLRAQRSDP